MKILVTGSRGFIGRNLIAHLKQRGYLDILEFDADGDLTLLDNYAERCDFVYHLAGVNRPQDPEEYMQGNAGFTQTLLEALARHENKAPILATSSVQAELDNPYGQSKKEEERLILDHVSRMGSLSFVYRLSNVFGKWCRPNYNSVVATFCYNIARDMPIIIHDRDTVINLVYIDDVATEFVRILAGDAPCRAGDFCAVQPVHIVTLGQISDLLVSFHDGRSSLIVPDFSDAFTKKLYSVYLTYLPVDAFAYSLKMNADNRGSFTEFLRTTEQGQVSVNISKPGIVKGNHWHHTKNEKFLVVSGEGIIRLRALESDQIIEYRVNEKKLRVVDIPPGYVHNIENIGNKDMVTIMWANELYNPKNSDTYALEV